MNIGIGAQRELHSRVFALYRDEDEADQQWGRLLKLMRGFIPPDDSRSWKFALMPPLVATAVMNFPDTTILNDNYVIEMNKERTDDLDGAVEHWTFNP